MPARNKSYHVSRSTSAIEDDFGQFPDGAHYNPFGKFLKRNGHKVTLYLGTNVDDGYYAIQCETEGCPGRGGSKIKHCPAVKGIRHCYGNCSSEFDQAVRNLIRRSFYYQMVHDKDGHCTYFDENNKHIQ